MSEDTRFQYFDPRVIALNQELTFHPDMQELLGKHAPDNFEMKMAELSSAFGIILDGDYYPEDLNNLAEILTRKLYERRTGVVLIEVPRQQQ